MGMARQTTARKPAKPVKDTGTKLVEAAAKEFRAHGFFGTDTNKIARRAGFAPQTFYRWFADKTAIFLAVYRAWEEEEKDVLANLHQRSAKLGEMVDAVVAHHRKYLMFRRSLRQLSVEDPAVRRARAESRQRQIDRFKKWQDKASLDTVQIAVMLFEVERLCDAIAEGEFVDLGLDDGMARKAVAELITRMRG